MAYYDADGFFIYAKIVVSFCTIAIIFMAIYHTIITCRASKQKQKQTTANPKKMSTTKTKILNILLQCYLATGAIGSIVGVMGYFGIETSSGTIHVNCYLSFVVGFVLYGISKTIVYYSYFLRLDVSFGGSGFEVNQILLKILYILSTLYLMAYFIAVPFDDKRDYSWNNKYNVCDYSDYNFNSLLGIVLTSTIIIYEGIVSILTLILFLRPLCYLMKVQHDKDLHDLTVKVGLLNSIVIISSIFGLVWYSFTAQLTTLYIDNVVNSLCLILMVNVHDKLYRKLCHLCISCKCCKFNDTVANMSMSQLEASL